MPVSLKRKQKLEALQKARQTGPKRAKHNHPENEKNHRQNIPELTTTRQNPCLQVGSRGICLVQIGGSRPNIPPATSPSSNSENSSDPENDPDSNAEENPEQPSPHRPPTIAQAEEALDMLEQALRTPLPSGGYKYAELDRVTTERCAAVKACLNQLLKAEPKGKGFIRASLDAARVQGRGAPYAQTIRKWTRRLIRDGNLPGNAHGWWNVSILEDEDVCAEIKQHLQRVGKYACAQDVVQFLSNPSVRTELGIKKKISMRTAQRWLSRAGFRWRSEPKGQYFDGHEREDVVAYRQQDYIPFLKAIERQRIIYNQDGIPDPLRLPRLRPGEKPIILWFHDESIFYANDRRTVRWVYIGEHPTPFKKGEGCSLMIADFVCSELGWLRGRNGDSARVTMFPGNDKDSWFTNNRVVLQLRNAVKIVKDNFPQFTHVFVYDNAPSHTKHSPSSLSAQGMPKGPLIDWPYYKNDKDERIFIRMEDGRLPDGSRQSFYDPDEPRRFKGMAWILRERGLAHLAEKNAVCSKGCQAGRTDCCCRRVMMNQPDFKSRDSTLQEAARQLGTHVIFLPKYHCELSMIEQCWGLAKRDYRDNPPNSNPKILKINALKAVDSVPILSMRKFGARAQRFVDGYEHGLNGSQAIDWATKVFKHHRETPGYIPCNEIR